MATQRRASINEILPLIRQQLIDKAVIGKDRCYIVARDVVPHHQADQDILIRPRGFVVEGASRDPGGRVTCRIARHVAIICRTRLALDEPDRDPQWLTNATLGHFALEERVPDALEEFFPTDPAGNILTTECIRMLSGDDPRTWKESPPAGESQEWGTSVLVYEVKYDLALKQTL